MSKTALKKELSGYTKEQVIEVLLDLYDNRKEVKEYFNFYLNPDSEKLFEKYRRMLDREFSRAKYRNSKARISRIKGYVKDFLAFHPELKYRHLIYVQSMRFALQYEMSYYFSDTLYNGIDRLLTEYLTFADRNDQLAAALDNMESLFDEFKKRSYCRRMKGVCDTYLMSQGI